MAKSINSWHGVGNLGREAETKTINEKQAVTNFSMATTYSYKPNGGDWVNETTWHNIVAWNLSDYVKKNLTKGSPVYVEGRLTKRMYKDKDGNEKLAVEIIANTVVPLAGKADNGSQTQSSAENNNVNNDTNYETVDDGLPF